MAKKRNPAKAVVEKFLEQNAPVSTPSFNPGRFRMAEERDRLIPTPSTDYNAIANDAAKQAAIDLAEAERLAQLAREMDARAKVEADLATSEAAKKAAEDAAAKAKADADAAAAAAAKAAAEEKARLEAELAKAKAAEDAARAAAAKAALDALNAANAAKGNINTAGNVFIPKTPAAGSMGAADILAKQYAEQQAAREKEQAMQRQSIMDVLTDRFTRYNLQGLIPTIKRLAQEGATESTITFALQ